MIIIGLSNSRLLAREIAKKLNIDYFDLDIKYSIDGEMHLRFNKDVKGKRVFLVQSLYPHQNSALVEVLFAANLTRELKAKEIILVAPYLSYLREDSRKEKYECVSSNILGNVLSNAVDAIVSVDPHLEDLKKYFSIPVYSISSIDLIKDYIKKNYENAIIVGPDENSRKFVMNLGYRFIVLKKKRKDELNVKFEKGYDLTNRKVLIIDDMIITGATMIGCIKYLDLKNKVDCITVHPVMIGDALKELEKYANNVVSCNTILNESNKINISGLIAGKIKNEWAS